MLLHCRRRNHGDYAGLLSSKQNIQADIYEASPTLGGLGRSVLPDGTEVDRLPRHPRQRRPAERTVHRFRYR